MQARMTGLVLAAVCCVLGISQNVAAAADTPPPLACVERLTLPRYPRIASSVRMEMVGLKASVAPAGDATVRSVSFEPPPQSSANAEQIRNRMFIQSVEASLRSAQYRKECGAETVTLVFDFRLARTPDEDGGVVFTYPNRFQLSDITRVIAGDSATTEASSDPIRRRR